MRKVIIISVVALLMVTVFLSPLFTERTHSVQFSLLPNKIIMADHEVREPEPVEEIPIQNFKNFHFETLIVRNTGSKIILYGSRSESIGIITPEKIYNRDYTKWYKTTLPTGYFYQINRVQIYSPKQILYSVSGNIGNSLFGALLSLKLGLILILLVSIWMFQQATT